MNEVYPKVSESPVVRSVDAGVLAIAIISKREAGKSKAECFGVMGELDSGDANKFDRVYDDVESERIKFADIDVSKFDTQTSYLSELAKNKIYLNENTWLTKLKDFYNVFTWADLKTALTPKELDK